jgi:GNAT superfamily N-acetyltransferase
MADERQRALRFLRDDAVRTAQRTAEHPWGFVCFDDRLPHAWDLNALWVDALPDDVDAAGLAAEADRVQGALAHRKVRIAADAHGSRVAPGLRSLGWTAEPLVLMAHRREPDRAAPADAREVGLATVQTVSALAMLTDGRLREDVRRQLVETKAVLAAAGVRFFASFGEEGPAAVCDLHEDDSRTAQIEAVLTLHEQRGRGHARAVVLAALDAARRAGADLVFLEAEEEDWPKELYVKLGFDRVGRRWSFTRPPA